MERKKDFEKQFTSHPVDKSCNVYNSLSPLSWTTYKLFQLPTHKNLNMQILSKQFIKKLMLTT